MNNWHKREVAAPLALLWNVLLAFFAFTITRLAFFLENYAHYAHLSSLTDLWRVFGVGIYFDASAIAYTNALYILMVLLPLHWKESTRWQGICRCVFVVLNGIALSANLCDAVYYQFTARRTTWSFFGEFSGNNNLGKIIGIEFVNHWYLVLLFVALLAMLWLGYVTPKVQTAVRRRYYLVQTLSLLVAAILCWAAMRGGFDDERPIRLSTANKFVQQPHEVSLLLNTPFCMIRTIGKDVYRNPQFFQSETELERVYTPIHQPIENDTIRKKNVVVIILESFGREYFGRFNEEILPGYKGYTAFLDSLIDHSLTFRYSFANGRKSIDAMPSALSGLPMIAGDYVVSSHANNRLEGMPGMLQSMGYETAFFHGAHATDMGFQEFAHSIGFQHMYSEEDYYADPRTGGQKDFDGTWGIWDEPFLQYFKTKMGDMHEPFMTTLFTLTSHHPFNIPEQYKDVFKGGELPIHRTIQYTDHALRRFFQEASKEPWFKNTVFVLTGDHTSISCHPEYHSSIGGFCTSIIFYDPSGSIAPGRRDRIVQQTDILPTILHYVGYRKPFMAFGNDLLNTPDEESWAINYFEGVYQYCKGNYVLRSDGEKTTGVFLLTDYRMENNLMGKVKEQRQLEREMEAVIQQYMVRMIENRLTAE